MPKTLLNRKTILGIRILSILCTIFLISVEVYNQFRNPAFSRPSYINFYSLRRLIGNIFVIFILLILSFYPHKFELLALACFYYTLICFLDDLNNPMGICMFFLGISILYIRGFFINNRKKKIIITIIFFFLLLFSKIHFGFCNFLQILVEHLGYTIVLSLILFILISYKQNIIINLSSNKILNLSEYPELVETDVVLLEKVLENKPYKIIAMEVLRAEGTVRNRLNKIYHTLGVIDRMGFISTYFGYEIIFKKEDVTSKDINDNNLPEQSLA